MSKTLTQIFHHKFEGNIWKIHPSNTEKIIVLEIRNASTHRTTFACLDLDSCSFLWQDFELHESWWLGLAKIYDKKMFFYLYPEIQKPKPQEILVVDLMSRQTLWHSKKHQFLGIENGKVVGMRAEKSDYVFDFLDIETGALIEEKSDFANLPTVQLSNTMLFPNNYRINTPYFDTVSQFIQKTQNIEPIWAIDYLEYEKYIIISYFFEKNIFISNNLLILDANAQILLNQCINEPLEGVIQDSYFIIHQILIFIKNKHEIIAYQL